jgi:hypothetical protein
MKWSTTAQAGDWIAERLHPFASDVGSVVPEGFAAYVRIPHPARDGSPARAGTLRTDQLDALTESLTVHTGRPDSCWFGVWDGYGWLQGPPAIARLERSGRRDASADHRAVPVKAARLHTPCRSYLLYEGPIHAAAAFCRDELTCQSPNLWWPEDHAWCVASEIDLYWTYVGGSQHLVDQLLHEEHHAACPVRITDPINA